MHVVLDRLHYFLVSPNIIWLPWQRPLTNPKIRYMYRSIICTKALSYGENIAKIGQVYPEISTKDVSFLAVSYVPDVHKIELCQHRS